MKLERDSIVAKIRRQLFRGSYAAGKAPAKSYFTCPATESAYQVEQLLSPDDLLKRAYRSALERTDPTCILSEREMTLAKAQSKSEGFFGRVHDRECRCPRPPAYGEPGPSNWKCDQGSSKTAALLEHCAVGMSNVFIPGTTEAPVKTSLLENDPAADSDGFADFESAFEGLGKALPAAESSPQRHHLHLARKSVRSVLDYIRTKDNDKEKQTSDQAGDIAVRWDEKTPSVQERDRHTIRSIMSQLLSRIPGRKRAQFIVDDSDKVSPASDGPVRDHKGVIFKMPEVRHVEGNGTASEHIIESIAPDFGFSSDVALPEYNHNSTVASPKELSKTKAKEKRDSVVSWMRRSDNANVPKPDENNAHVAGARIEKRVREGQVTCSRSSSRDLNSFKEVKLRWEKTE